MTCAMRLPVLALALAAFVGCRSSKSKLDADRAAAADALWDFAPDGTRLGIVASPRAVGLAFRALDAIRELSKQPDFTAAKPQIDAVVRGLLGSPTATPADAGYFATKGFALFETAEGVAAIMPVADRDKYMNSRHGARGSGSADDT